MLLQLVAAVLCRCKADFRWRRCRGFADILKQGFEYQTLAYRSPEVLFGDSTFGSAVDVFSLGITLFELAGGTAFKLPSPKTWSREAWFDLLVAALGAPCYPDQTNLPLFPRGFTKFPETVLAYALASLTFVSSFGFAILCAGFTFLNPYSIASKCICEVVVC
jgi:serine/threonine protein kinase